MRSRPKKKNESSTSSGRYLTGDEVAAKLHLPVGDCKHAATKVIDSRPSKFTHIKVRRRRECIDCGYRFTTCEVSAEHIEAVRDMDFERYLQRKIRKGLEDVGAYGSNFTAE